MRAAPPRALAAPVLLPALSVGAVLALWEVAPRAGWVRRTSVPPASEVLREVGAVLGDGAFYADLRASAGRWALGLGLALLIGVPLGLLMGRSRAAFSLLDPLLTLMYPVPKVAFVVLFVLWFGAGDVTRVLIIVLGSLIPVVVSAYHGAKGVEPRLLWSAWALGTGRLAAFAKVVLPSALPQVLSGVRLAITISIFTLLGSELLVRRSGVGAYLFTNLDNGQFLRVWATSVVVAAIGFLLDVAYVAAVRRALGWFEGEV